MSLKERIAYARRLVNDAEAAYTAIDARGEEPILAALPLLYKHVLLGKMDERITACIGHFCKMRYPYLASQFTDPAQEESIKEIKRTLDDFFTQTPIDTTSTTTGRKEGAA
jgi:hypothetical protein